MSYNQQMYGQGPPEVPYPWVAEWDYNSNGWLFVNPESGERTYEYPVRSFNSYQDYGGTNNQYSQEPPNESHTGRNAAFGAVGGLAAGAFLMHEGDKIGKSSASPSICCLTPIRGGLGPREGQHRERRRQPTGERGYVDG